MKETKNFKESSAKSIDALFYGIALQFKMDFRSGGKLVTCYIVPLLFFAVMSGIFTSISPEAKNTLIQSMSIFGVSMSALIGLPPSLVEIYASDIKKVYKANGVPISFGFVLSNVSAFIHLFIMCLAIYFVAPLAFDAELPKNPAVYFVSLAFFIIVSLFVASIIGLTVKDQVKTPAFSIALFLPSVMFSGIMFPAELLPKPFEIAGKIFPATWGFELLAENLFRFRTLFPLALIFLSAFLLCVILLKRNRE